MTRRTGKRRVTKPATKKPAPGEPVSSLRIVRRPPRTRSGSGPATAPPPESAQREGASPKQLLLFELVRGRARVLAAVQGLPAGPAEQRTGRGRWSIRETVLHLHAWDLEWERALEPALRGVRPAWVEHDPGDLARLNRALLVPLQRLPWDEALRRLHMGRARLLEAIESLPEEPATLWTREHPLGEVLALLAEHDHHHAGIIKRARTGAQPPSRTP